MTHLGQVVSPNDQHEQRVRSGDAFRARLEQHRRFRIEQLKGLEGDRLAGNDATDAVTSDLVTAASAALQDIVAALHRIEDGCFGICQQCGEVIALDRLTALPMASLCMDCQYAKEMRGPLPADIVDVWGYGSFPASDPPANW
ncbi:TraR/DksA family transcriptional regulator [Kribbella sp. NPDC023855]|uniref:TraR/DksA family transcriptional regulator n=1 Tax=Kribbella sp. NPDC023855 TaxID=3154698 RepID=UPI0033FC62BB